MSYFVIVDNDTLQFGTTFGMYTVTPTEPCMIKASGIAQILNKKVCVVGDEKKVSIKATYMNATYPTPGTGSITITSLAADQQATFALSTAPLIVIGSQFIALFTPQAPASNPQGPEAAPSPQPGNGKFMNSQTFVTTG
ncbi:hypothetical protein AAEY27_00450 [Kosakonia sp. BYX6]|uniref:Uncharacterized protein n=1 Tax=Kosakonia calanthes TaxID=3139408 RepID=A0ABZ3B4Z5_9ENTR